MEANLDSRQRLSCWMPLVAAVVVRLLCLPLARDIPDTGDSVAYVGMAREFLRDFAFVDLAVGVRPPLFRMLVALGLDRSTHPLDPFPGSFLVQIAADVLACGLLMGATRRLAGERAARIAGWIYALHPAAVLYASLLIMAESATAALLAGAVWQLVRIGAPSPGDVASSGARRGLRSPWTWLGVLLGLGILMKEVVLPVTGAVLLGLLLHFGRRRLLAVAGVGLLALAVTSPWIVRNLRVHDMLIVSSTAGDLVLMHGNMPLPRSGAMLDGMQRWSDIPTLRGKVEAARGTFARALTEYPVLTARRAWTRLRIALGPEIIPPVWIGYHLEGLPMKHTDGYGLLVGNWRMPSGTWARTVQIACGVASVLLFGFGAAGLVLLRGHLLARLVPLLAGLLVAAWMLTWSESRYMLTLVPFVVPCAAVAIDRVLAARSARDERRALAPPPSAEAEDLRVAEHLRDAADLRASLSPAQRAERVGWAVALLFVLTIFVLPPPPIP